MQGKIKYRSTKHQFYLQNSMTALACPVSFTAAGWAIQVLSQRESEMGGGGGQFNLIFFFRNWGGGRFLPLKLQWVLPIAGYILQTLEEFLKTC